MSLFPFATTEDLTLTDQEVTASSIREYEIDFEKGTLTGEDCNWCRCSLCVGLLSS